MKKIVAVHDGVFHADDAFAVAAMQRIAEVEVFRSRRPEILAGVDIRVDVGGEYSPEKATYDHHQRRGAGFRENGIPYAGFGLVWKHYGFQIAGDQEVARLVEEIIVQPVDAADCGFALEGEEKVKGVRPYSISAAISAMNPGWDELTDFDAAFGCAVEFAGGVLGRVIARAAGVVKAKELVRQAIVEAADPRLVILTTFCPWQEVIVEESAALFVCFPSETGDWRIQAIPPELGSFAKRRELPEVWAGKRGAELAELTGVADAVFCHPGRFIAGAVSKEGILRLAALALAD